MDATLTRVNDNYPYDLLLADPSRCAVDDYLQRGECWVLREGERTVGVYVLLPTRPFTAELVNIAVAEDRQRCGLGQRLITHFIAHATGCGYHKLEVGTATIGLVQIAFYQKNGFIEEWIDRDFFLRHYPSLPIDNGQHCRDMIRLGRMV